MFAAAQPQSALTDIHDSPGASLRTMMSHLTTPAEYLAPDGVITLNEFRDFSNDGTPKGPPVRVSQDPANHSDPYLWSCSGLVLKQHWDKSGKDHHGFLQAIPEDGGAEWITTFMASPDREEPMLRPFRAHWERTSKGWRVRTLDVKQLSDEDEQDCN